MRGPGVAGVAGEPVYVTGVCIFLFTLIHMHIKI